MMINGFWRVLAISLVIAGLMLAPSCAKKKVKSEPGVISAAEAERLAAEEAMSTQEAEALREQRIEEELLREQAWETREREERAERERFLNVDVHFEFDKSTLTPETKEILTGKAKWLMAHPKVAVIIEGHCDERGTNEYNMALGDRRTRSVERFLLDLGVQPERMTTISYGEEKPADPRHNEEAWAKNRRVHFVIV